MPSKKLRKPLFIQDLNDQFAPRVLHDNVMGIYHFLDTNMEWGSATSNTGVALSKIKSADYIINITPLITVPFCSLKQNVPLLPQA